MSLEETIISQSCHGGKIKDTYTSAGVQDAESLCTLQPHSVFPVGLPNPVTPPHSRKKLECAPLSCPPRGDPQAKN